MRCLGTSVHLKQKHGKGFIITLQTLPTASDAAISFVRGAFPGAEMTHNNAGHARARACVCVFAFVCVRARVCARVCLFVYMRVIIDTQQRRSRVIQRPSNRHQAVRRLLQN